MFKVHINRARSYWDNHVFDLLLSRLWLGDDLLSMSPMFFWVPLGIQWHRTAIIVIIESLCIPLTRDWTWVKRCGGCVTHSTTVLYFVCISTFFCIIHWFIYILLCIKDKTKLKIKTLKDLTTTYEWGHIVHFSLSQLTTNL